MMSGMKADVSEFYTANGHFPGGVVSIYGLTATAPNPVVGHAVEKIPSINRIDNHHVVISAWMNKTIFPPSACPSVAPFYCVVNLYASTGPEAGSIEWICGRRGTKLLVDTNLPYKWLPANCRQ
ncbi:MAG: hypothetical protein LBB55_02150 [Zoogloeaceae bacterium]|nr:hypothetical protein [Zoogloeaceae bacterium]